MGSIDSKQYSSAAVTYFLIASVISSFVSFAGSISGSPSLLKYPLLLTIISVGSSDVVSIVNVEASITFDFVFSSDTELRESEFLFDKPFMASPIAPPAATSTPQAAIVLMVRVILLLFIVSTPSTVFSYSFDVILILEGSESFFLISALNSSV